ncbi:91_t:CDS:2, partial [Scutellospora calospora]
QQIQQQPSQLVSSHPPDILSPTLAPRENITSNINYTRFFRKHILTAKDFSRNDLHLLFGVAHEMRTLVNLMPSTRMSASFEATMNRLGDCVVTINTDSSFITKADTVRTVGSYGDIIILRHPEPGSIKTAAKYSPVPIINAGDGVGEHPTQ